MPKYLTNQDISSLPQGLTPHWHVSPPLPLSLSRPCCASTRTRPELLGLTIAVTSNPSHSGPRSLARLLVARQNLHIHRDKPACPPNLAPAVSPHGRANSRFAESSRQCRNGVISPLLLFATSHLPLRCYFRSPARQPLSTTHSLADKPLSSPACPSISLPPVIDIVSFPFH